MATAEVFSKRLDRIAVNIEGNTEKGMRKAALAIDNALVTSTPVDTGRARSNWIMNFDSPASGTRPATDQGSALAANQGKLATFDLSKNVAIHLTNNLPYIGKLNEGSSDQAPAGFVQGAVLAGLQAVKSIKLLKR